MQRLTATMKFPDGLPPDLTDQMVKQFSVDYSERKR